MCVDAACRGCCNMQKETRMKLPTVVTAEGRGLLFGAQCPKASTVEVAEGPMGREASSEAFHASDSMGGG